MEWTNLADNPKLADVKQQLKKWLPQKNAPEAPFDAELRGGKKGKK